MATQGSYNGHERRATQDNSRRSGEGRSNREYRPRDSRNNSEFRGNGESRGNGEFRGNGDYRNNRGNNENRTGQSHGEYRRRDNNNRNFRSNDGKSGYKPRDTRGSYGGYNNYAKDHSRINSKRSNGWNVSRRRSRRKSPSETRKKAQDRSNG